VIERSLVMSTGADLLKPTTLQSKMRKLGVGRSAG
jgi:hypothetical protein